MKTWRDKTSREKRTEYQSRWRRKNWDRLKIKQRERNKLRRKKSKTSWNETIRKGRARRRREVLDKYGGVCVCCGEDKVLFLTLDHVNEDGAEHRRKLGGSSRTIISWARKNLFPNTLQVLCFNCNLGKSLNGGICPHKGGGGDSCKEPDDTV